MKYDITNRVYKICKKIQYNLERMVMLDKILSREDGRGYIWSINILLLYFYMEYVNNANILCLLFYSVIATDIYIFLRKNDDEERLHLILTPVPKVCSLSPPN